MFHTLQAAPDRNGCWPQSSIFVRTACAVLGTSPSFDAQPTLLSFTAHQRNFGSRQTHGEKHRNPARGQRNFWLLFLPWKSKHNQRIAYIILTDAHNMPCVRLKELLVTFSSVEK